MNTTPFGYLFWRCIEAGLLVLGVLGYVLNFIWVACVMISYFQFYIDVALMWRDQLFLLIQNLLLLYEFFAVQQLDQILVLSVNFALEIIRDPVFTDRTIFFSIWFGQHVGYALYTKSMFTDWL